DEAELHPDVGMAAVDRLQHQKLVEVGVVQRADDGVDTPGVVVDAGCDVGHASSSVRVMRTPPERICRMAASSEPSRSMARQASSSSTTSKPCASASIADQETQKSVASPASQTRRTPRSFR